MPITGRGRVGGRRVVARVIHCVRCKVEIEVRAEPKSWEVEFKWIPG
jgi:hypothetical protein